MARKLSAHDKLALALTSAGSMRELARRVGVTHQRIGRWLREGEPGGVKAIPSDFFTQQAIEDVFKLHRSEVRERARRERVPYNPDVPVMMERRPLKTGEPGDRVRVKATEFIPPELRRAVFQGAVDSGKFYAGSVRSVVTLRTYFRGRAADELARGRRHGISQPALADAMLRSWIAREKRVHGRTIEPEQPFPLYTRSEGLRITPGDTTAVEGVEKQLRQKHEPATGKPGTVAADEYLFQLTPKDYVPPVFPKRTTRRRRTRKPAR